MKINVLYGEDVKRNFSSEYKYILNVLKPSELKQWDGCYDYDIDSYTTNSGQLSEIVPENILSFDIHDRIMHSFGRSSPELLSMKHKKLAIVDAVIYPNNQNIIKVIENLRKYDYKVIIYGGGTSVNGSLSIGESKKVISLDTRNFKQFEIYNDYAIAGAGITGPELENELNKYGYTIGNFPESFKYSTLGGWIATKATGQESNMYGGIENIVISSKMITSSGVYQDKIVPRESSGLQIKSIAIGSEGNYGLITEAAIKLFRKPGKRVFRSYFFKSFDVGLNALKSLKEFPAVARLSDELETDIAINGSKNSTAKKILEKYLKLRGVNKGSLLILVDNEGKTPLKNINGIRTGSIPSKNWIDERYSRPGIANILWKNGLVTDTLETSTDWGNLSKLYHNVISEFNRVKDTLNISGIIMGHVSHLYKSGACIYFTFILSLQNEESELKTVRDTIIRTFLKNGGAITDHHGIGTLFRDYMDKNILEMQSKLYDKLFSWW